MKAKLKSVLNYLNVLLFSSDVLNPPKLLFILVISFLIANSRINYFLINIPFIYITFIKLFLKNFVIISTIISLPRFAKFKLAIPFSIALIILTWKLSEMKLLVILFLLFAIHLIKPSGINPNILPAFLSFALGLRNSHKSWIDLDTATFLILPYILLVMESSKKASSDLSATFLFFFLTFLSRPIGMISGSLFFIAKRMSILFPKTEIFISFLLPFVSFFFGYIYFIEFQRGIPIGEPFLFLSKIYIPAILSVIYPLASLISLIVRGLKRKLILKLF